METKTAAKTLRTLPGADRNGADEHTLLTNFNEDMLAVYTAAVCVYNNISKKDILEIKRYACDVYGTELPSYHSLHYTPEYDKEGLNAFWALFEYIRDYRKKNPIAPRLDVATTGELLHELRMRALSGGYLHDKAVRVVFNKQRINCLDNKGLQDV